MPVKSEAMTTLIHRRSCQLQIFRIFILIPIRFKIPAFRPERAPPRPEGRGFNVRSGGVQTPPRQNTPT
jgi:hypothetical protein